MQTVGRILELFVSYQGNSTRLPQQSLHLDNKGVLNDKFYNKDIERSVLLTSTESYDLAQSHDINLTYGDLGENILMDYNPYQLTIGSQLYIGGTILEISQLCTICNHLSVFDKQLPKLLKKDRGIFAKVIRKGMITRGDSIRLKTPLN